MLNLRIIIFHRRLRDQFLDTLPVPLLPHKTMPVLLTYIVHRMQGKKIIELLRIPSNY